MRENAPKFPNEILPAEKVREASNEEFEQPAHHKVPQSEYSKLMSRRYQGEEAEEPLTQAEEERLDYLIEQKKLQDEPVPVEKFEQPAHHKEPQSEYLKLMSRRFQGVEAEKPLTQAEEERLDYLILQKKRQDEGLPVETMDKYRARLGGSGDFNESEDSNPKPKEVVSNDEYSELLEELSRLEGTGPKITEIGDEDYKHFTERQGKQYRNVPVEVTERYQPIRQELSEYQQLMARRFQGDSARPQITKSERERLDYLIVQKKRQDEGLPVETMNKYRARVEEENESKEIFKQDDGYETIVAHSRTASISEVKKRPKTFWGKVSSWWKGR